LTAAICDEWLDRPGRLQAFCGATYEGFSVSGFQPAYASGGIYQPLNC